LGAALVLLGLVGMGPLAGAAGDERSFSGLVVYSLAGMALGAALLFRARYREYAGARQALLVALVFSLPAVVHAGITVASGPIAVRVAASLVVATILSSVVGFWGDGTTTVSMVWAMVVIVVLGVEWVVEPIGVGVGWHSYHRGIRLGLSLMVGCVLMSKGLFQLLVAAFAADARRVDVLRRSRGSLRDGSGPDF
jgi:hypothetical protein